MLHLPLEPPPSIRGPFNLTYAVEANVSKPSTTSSFLALCSALSIGCLQPSTAKDESADDTTPAETTSIYDIQMGVYAEGTEVTVSGAVVTTPVIPGDNAGFFIQSAEGGEFNGIYIYMYDEVAEAYSPTVGDVIDITGEYAEFYENSQLKVTAAENITVTGSGAEVVVSELTAEPESWEAYESVMVKLTDAEITDASKLYEWGAVQLAIGCWMDNVFTNYEAETCGTYESITGPITYSYEKYSILPRTEADLVGYSTASEGGSCETICDDGVDNDGDGLTDCDDPNCAGDDACLTDEICDDGLDNDGDSYIDCNDFDCDDDPACEGAGETDCDDGIDNDDNGYVDCDDFDCNDDPACGGTGGDEICDDGIDNDGDSYVDCDDWDCDDDAACGGSSESEVCDDGIDNDGDSYVDCDDWDCDDDAACGGSSESEVEVCDDGIDMTGTGRRSCGTPVRARSATTRDCDDDWDCDDDAACDGSGGSTGEDEVCDDGIDNDGDSFVDCDDWDCDDDPACPGETVCDDGIDNDGNGYTDCEDFDCTYDAACAEDCTDGEDNDGDGYIDCDDFYCDEDPACAE